MKLSRGLGQGLMDAMHRLLEPWTNAKHSSTGGGELLTRKSDGSDAIKAQPVMVEPSGNRLECVYTDQAIGMTLPEAANHLSRFRGGKDGYRYGEAFLKVPPDRGYNT